MPRCTLFPTRPINLKKNWKELAHRGELYITAFYHHEKKVWKSWHTSLYFFLILSFNLFYFSHQQVLCLGGVRQCFSDVQITSVKLNKLDSCELRMTNRTFEQISAMNKCWQWPVWGFYGWERKCEAMFASLFLLGSIYFQPIVFLHRLLRLSQLVSLWSHRKIHHVSLNHQSDGGEEPFLVCGPRCSV